MPSLTLEHRRATVAGFWIVGAAVLFIASAGVAALAGSAHPWVWAVAVPTAALLPGAFWVPWFGSGVWVWNGVTWRLMAVLRSYVLWVGYFVGFGALGPFASRRDLSHARFAASGWTRRGWRAGRLQRQRVRPGETSGSQHGFVAFARTPGNRWSLCLLPMVFLLTLLRDEQQDTAVPGTTYTLY